MNAPSSYAELTKLIKTSSNEDTVWLLHVINKDKCMYERNKNHIHDLDSELVSIDINLLNTFKNLNEIKNKITLELDNLNENEIKNLITDIHKYSEQLIYKGYNLSPYLDDERLLNLFLHSYSTNNEDYYQDIKKINNKYFQFLYIISVCEYGDNVLRLLNRVQYNYSKVLTERLLHFKKYDSIEFYKWAIQYIHDDRSLLRRYNLRDFQPIQDVDFKVAVLSILDMIYDHDRNAYQLLKEKMSNAWYQKIYRQNTKGKKHYYFFKDRTQECLKIICQKNNLNEEKMLDQLINEYYVTHCTYPNSGKDMYSS
ncbi:MULTISPECIES: hypothetical protein [Acinetobacter]|uniref:hypothetical protein n=1 Tax=Acinetobacter TaxID=469 RepID=UPI00125F4B51|nr:MULTISPECIES: hypothetical protein [Acinetobacter]MBI0395448.1 hypothetical protein [Acinetobacter bereziniae]MCU4321315.1 hypothetical protein [Acinetobacter bereziniae]